MALHPLLQHRAVRQFRERHLERVQPLLAAQQPLAVQRGIESPIVIPGWSEGPDPESRDSGFDASHRPGMTGHHTVPPRIGGWYDSAVSQGKWIQVSCDTSVM